MFETFQCAPKWGYMGCALVNELLCIHSHRATLSTAFWIDSLFTSIINYYQKLKDFDSFYPMFLARENCTAHQYFTDIWWHSKLCHRLFAGTRIYQNSSRYTNNNTISAGSESFILWNIVFRLRSKTDSQSHSSLNSVFIRHSPVSLRLLRWQRARNIVILTLKIPPRRLLS